MRLSDQQTNHILCVRACVCGVRACVCGVRACVCVVCMHVCGVHACVWCACMCTYMCLSKCIHVWINACRTYLLVRGKFHFSEFCLPVCRLKLVIILSAHDTLLAQLSVTTQDKMTPYSPNALRQHRTI